MDDRRTARFVGLFFIAATGFYLAGPALYGGVISADAVAPFTSAQRTRLVGGGPRRAPRGLRDPHDRRLPVSGPSPVQHVGSLLGLLDSLSPVGVEVVVSGPIAIQEMVLAGWLIARGFSLEGDSSKA